MWIELKQIMGGDVLVDEPMEKLIPQFLSDRTLESDTAKILLDEDISIERINEFLMMDMLRYVPQYFDGNLCKAYVISSLSQLFALEILKVQESKNKKYKYAKCPICNRIFIQKAGIGNIRKYCEYPYSKGLCKIGLMLTGLILKIIIKKCKAEYVSLKSVIQLYIMRFINGKRNLKICTRV
jgi:hypothetical protein